MEANNRLQEQKYIRAKKRVEELKGYYWHLVTYIIINLFLSGAQIIEGISENRTFETIFSDFGLYGVWIVWGIGLFFHTFKIFGFRFFLGNDWEEQKIKEIMNKNN
ncbi:2TM domain-containing protein [Polaribacter cellanae]|uniref:2TM domain-containing protein n=1 Tax=Polaribacter cellanae TaxID=2818493 RepID=A0A975CPS9_9FLAO|nr:2TM domain-containing protein [Polaribacter cellanae]QTE23513.1 2TM domain-containing protein [Polaribacter cellanae]